MANHGSVDSGSYQGRCVRFEWGTNSVNSATNVRNIWYKVTAVGGSSSTYYHHNNQVLINDTEVLYDAYQASSVAVSEGTIMGQGNMNINQNNVGHLIVEMYGGIYNYSGTLDTIEQWELDDIPRYTSITSFTVSKRNETSVTYSFTAADTCDYVWYSTNNGGNWTGVDITDGTSASFVVSGLSPNTAYNFKLRVRRKDSQLTTDSGTVSQSTYKVPTQSLSSKTENRATISWSVDSTADYIWYSINNGSSWTAVGAVSGTTGSYTITGLSPNTSYNIKTRVRRSASQTTYDTATLSVTTYKAPTQALNTKTETSIKMNWSADSTIDYIWYSTNNGSSWTGIDVTDGTSGSYTISNLSANTTYQIKTRVRRKATQTTYDTAALSVATYDYPYVTGVGTSSLVIGNSQTLTLYNPLSRSVTVKMYQTNTSGTELYSGTTSGTSITFTPTANTLYASIPNTTSSYCVYSVIYGSSTKTTSSNTYSYKIIGTEVPTFSDFTYADTNSTTTALTGNNQILVSGYSNVTATISTSNKATANNSATMKNYVLSIGTQSAQANYSSSSEVTLSLNKVTNSSIKVTANDSRGLGKSVTKTATIKNYVKPAITSMTAVRSNNGVGETVTLTFAGNWWNDNFGSTSNDIQNIKYYYRKSTTNTWTTGTTTITWTTSSGNFNGSLVIEGDTETLGFDVTASYFIKIKATDKLDVSEEYQVTLGSGTPAIAIYKDNVAIGQQYNTSTGEKLQVNGAVKASSFDGNASSSTYSTNVRTTPTNPSSGTTYYGTFLSGNTASTNYPIRTNDGFRYETKGGTTEAEGRSVLALGNSSATGTDLNKKGYLRLYSSSTSYSQILAANTTSAISHTLPATGGTILNTGTTSYTATQTSGNAIGTLKINGTDTVLYSKDSVTNATNASKATADGNGLNIVDGYSKANTKEDSGLSFDDVGSGKALQRSGLYSAYISNTWYDLINIRHRNGNNDGVSYGMQFMTAMTSLNNGLFLRKQSGNSWTGWERILRYKNLYDNSSGTSGSVTLSESAANFAFIRIYFMDNNKAFQESIDVYSPNGKSTQLFIGESYSNGGISFRISRVKISTTTVSYEYNSYVNVSNNALSGQSNTNYVKIVRIDGYR